MIAVALVISKFVICFLTNAHWIRLILGLEKYTPLSPTTDRYLDGVRNFRADSTRQQLLGGVTCPTIWF